MTVLLVAARLAAFVGGGIMCYGALFLYETEERTIQNTLEGWWVRIDDLRTRAIARHTAVIRTAAHLVRRGLDRLFGERLLSIKAFGVSVCFSIASISLTAATSRVIARETGQVAESSNILLVLAVNLSLPVMTPYIWQVTLFAVAALLAARAAHYSRLRYMPAIFFALYLAELRWLGIGAIAVFEERISLAALLAFVVVLGVTVDFLVVAFLRKLLAHQEASSSSLKFYFQGSIAIAIAALALCGPIWLGLTLHDLYGRYVNHYWFHDLAIGITVSSLTNIPAGVVTLLFGTSVLLLVMHRITWPTIERPLYQLARMGIFRNHATRSALFSLGTALILVSSGRARDVFEFLRALFSSA